MRSGFATACLLLVLTSIRPAYAVQPSFCEKPDTPLTKLVCANPDLSTIELRYIQAYHALQYQMGEAGDAELLHQAIQFHRKLLATCHIPSSGIAPPATDRLTGCMEDQYRKQRDEWIGHLTIAAARQEATRPFSQYVRLQSDLKLLGYLPSSAQIDGVYGAETRAAIVAWQQSLGRTPSGFLGDRDAQTLAAEADAGMTRNPVTMAEMNQFSCRDIQRATQRGLVPIIMAELKYIQQTYPDLTSGWGSTSQPPTRQGLRESIDIGAFVKTDCNQPGEQNVSLSSVLDSAARLMRTGRLGAWIDTHPRREIAGPENKKKRIAEADYRAAMSLWTPKNPARAIPLLKDALAADNDYAPAKFQLGVAYDDLNIPTPTDFSTWWQNGRIAIRLVEGAALQGYPAAEQYLGDAYSLGAFVQQSYRKAYIWSYRARLDSKAGTFTRQGAELDVEDDETHLTFPALLNAKHIAHQIKKYQIHGNYGKIQKLFDLQ